MSRPLKLIMCAAALSAGGGVALAAAAPGSAPARGGSHVIVCPLEPNATVTTPCCGPPVVTVALAAPVCCGTPEPINCPVGVALSSSPNPSTAGQKVTLSGRSPGNTAGQTVDLWQEVPGAKTFTDVAHTQTGPLGQFRFVRKGVETNRMWYVTVGSEHSVTSDQQVMAVVTFSLGAAMHGQVTPNHAGERVWLEQKAASGWKVVARARLSGESTYGFRASPCEGLQRVVFPGDRRNAPSASPQLAAVCSH
jgi:hypothetical protein